MEHNTNMNTNLCLFKELVLTKYNTWYDIYSLHLYSLSCLFFQIYFKYKVTSLQLFLNRSLNTSSLLSSLTLTFSALKSLSRSPWYKLHSIMNWNSSSTFPALHNSQSLFSTGSLQNLPVSSLIGSIPHLICAIIDLFWWQYLTCYTSSSATQEENILVAYQRHF